MHGGRQGREKCEKMRGTYQLCLFLWPLGDHPYLFHNFSVSWPADDCHYCWLAGWQAGRLAV